MPDLVYSDSSGTNVHTNDTNEQTVFTLTPTQNNNISGVWLDLVNLTQNATVRAKYAIDGTTLRTFSTTAWTTGMDDGLLIAGSIPVDSSFSVTIQSAALEGASRNIPYKVFWEGLGVGAIAWVYTLTDGTNPIADAQIWITTDLAGANIIASGLTNANGQVTFRLDSGTTVYVWRQRSGWNFSNPDTEIVSA